MPSGSSEGCESSASWVCGSNLPSVATSESPSRCEHVGERAVDEPHAVARASPRRARPPRSSARSRSSSIGSSCFTSRSDARSDEVAPARGRRACGSCRTRPSAAGARRGTRRARRIASASSSASGRPRTPGQRPRPLPPASTGPHRSPGSSRTARSRGLGLFAFVDDLVVGVLDHLVVGAGGAVAAVRGAASADAWA